MSDGLSYRAFDFGDSRLHVLRINLLRRELRPVVDVEAFPIRSGHAQAKAVAEGALACADGCFNVTLDHHLGISDQPQHALVIDREIWTTGLGAGGYGVLIGDRWVGTQKNAIRVHVWRPDGSAIEVEHVNRGHDGHVVAFTRRGGTNEYPIPGKNYALLRPTGRAIEVDGAYRVSMQVAAPVEPFVLPTPVGDDWIVLEGRWPLRMPEGTLCTWVQRLGAPDVRHVISGWPEMVHDGENVVKYLNLDPEAPKGPDNWFVRRNPRSAIGCSEDGHTAYIVVAEGRLPNEYRPKAEPSAGLRLKMFGEFARRRGIPYIVNMDGGGSAFLWTQELGMVAPGCYNQTDPRLSPRSPEWITGQRPALFAAAVF